MTTSPNEKRRPGKAANQESLAGDTSRIQPIGDTSVSTGRRYWARQLIERQTPDRPMYGSSAWLALGNDHPDKIAACVIAAECWAAAADTLEQDLRREIEGLQLGHKREEDRAYVESAAAHRQKYNGMTVSRSFEARRRQQIADADARPGDFPGRGERA